MKKVFFAIMTVAFMATVLTGCDGLKLGSEDIETTRMSQMSVVGDKDVIKDSIWIHNDGEFRVKVPYGVVVYNNDTTLVTEVSLATKSFDKVGEEIIGNRERGELVSATVSVKSVYIRRHTQVYKHVLDKVSGELEMFWYEAEVELEDGRKFVSPDRNASLNNNGQPSIEAAGYDDDYNYHKATMTYDCKIDNDSANVFGYKTLKIQSNIHVEKVDEGFTPLTYDNNGNLKTGKSWIEIKTTINGKSTTDRKQIVLNFWQNGEPRKVEDGVNFDGVKEIGSGIGSEVDGTSFDDGEFTVTPSTITCNSGVLFSGTNYNKVLVFGRERAIWSDGENSFEMPSPAYENVYKEFVVSSSYEDGEYECKLNTITMHGSIYGQDIKNVKAETELRVKKEEEPETFTIAVVDSAFVYINPTTSDTKITIRETGNKGTVREYERDVHVYNGIDDLGCVTIDVTEFDSKASEAKLDANDVYIGKRESGEFTVYKYMQGYTTGSESVDEYFRPYYERAYYNPTGTWMMWRKYENFVDNGFTTTDLSNETVSDVTYLRKKYVYTMSAVYNGHNDSATGEAILRVVSSDDPQPVDPRVTPSWLGDPQWAEYTRVQKSEGAYFEDMIVFGYANGVVLAPKGVVDLNLVFAYDQSVADAHGVQKCARGSAYTGVWKASASSWIPAKCETQNSGKSNETWIYTGRGVSHSVMANNAITLHIGTNVTWNPGEEVTISDGTITVKYSKNNSSLNGNDLVSLK